MFGATRSIAALCAEGFGIFIKNSGHFQCNSAGLDGDWFSATTRRVWFFIGIVFI